MKLDSSEKPRITKIATEEASVSDFEIEVQQLVVNFLNAHASSVDHQAAGLVRVYEALAFQLGRVDGAARLHGIPHEETLQLLRERTLAGKAVTLHEHEACGCACEVSQGLRAEVELN